MSPNLLTALRWPPHMCSEGKDKIKGCWEEVPNAGVMIEFFDIFLSERSEGLSQCYL